MIPFLTAAAAIALLCGCIKNTPDRAVLSGGQTTVSDILEQGIAEAEPTVTVPSGSPSSDPDPAETADLYPVISVDVSQPTEPPPTVIIEEEAPKVIRGDAVTDVDIDLTKMSSTMVYAEVYSMLTEPEQYVGKTVRMRGDYAFYHDKNQDKYYFACLVRDAMACCAQGLEFVLSDDYAYPADYPENGQEVTIRGVFTPYQETNYSFFHLTDAVWEK